MVLRELRLFIVIEHINNKSVFKGGGFFFRYEFWFVSTMCSSLF